LVQVVLEVGGGGVLIGLLADLIRKKTRKLPTP
jgi:hypothetical protein